MSLIDIKTELEHNSYPGRGIVIGKSADGVHAVIAYFIMGRSENSRNRIFIEDEKGIKTKAFDETKLVDPSLIIYSPVRVLNNTTVVTNGDQTDTVFEFLKQGKTFEQALRTRTFEPDPPNFTPRISGVVENLKGDFTYKLSILKSDNGNEASAQRFFFEYPQPLDGQGHFIHTYECDGDPIPSFQGEPKAVVLNQDIEAFTKTLWNSLNQENKVSLFTRYINLTTGETKSIIVNKNN